MSARNRELLALIPASLLVTLGFAAIFGMLRTLHWHRRIAADSLRREEVEQRT